MMNDEIRAAIEKTLPAEMSKMLQERLASADRMEKRVKTLEDEIERLGGENREYYRKAAKVVERKRDLDVRQADLDKDTKSHLEWEHRLELTRMEASSNGERATEFRDIIHAIAAGPVMRRTLTTKMVDDYDKCQQMGTDGNYHQPQKNETEETTTGGQ